MSFFAAPLFIRGFLLIALLGGLAPFCLPQASADDATPSATASAASSAPQNGINATLAWAGITRLSTPVSGVVAAIPVQAGQVVARGSVLLRLERAPFADRLAAISAERAGLVRAAAEAKRDAERTQQLYDRTVASESERQDALIKQEKTQAQLNATKARVDLTQWELARSELLAPFAARILSIDTAVGETVSSELNAPVLLRIARADELLAQAMVSPNVAAGVHLGQTLAVVVNQTTVQGQVVALVSDEATVQNSASNGEALGVRYRLVVQIKPEQGWIAGLPARIDLP
jgi:multidrug efflux system membrane fusion protein